MHKSRLAHLALLLTNIIFGLNYPLAKGLMPDHIMPFGFIFCRVGIALSLFFIVGSFLKKKEKIARKDWLRLIFCGLFGIALNQLSFFYGLNITTPINASIIMTSNPVLVLIIAAILIKESISFNKILGIIIGLSGALLLLMFKKDFHFGSSTLPGDLLVLLNATSYAVYLVLVKPLMKKYRPFTVIKWVFFFGFIFVFPFGFNQFTAVAWHSFTPKIWTEFTFVVLAATFLTYLLNIFALSYVNPSTAAIYIYIQPLIAATVAIMLQEESLTIIKIISAILIFSGVYLVSKRRRAFKTQQDD